MPSTRYASRSRYTTMPKLCSGVTLNRREGKWFATFIVERKGPKAKSSEVVGVDIGMASIVSTSHGRGMDRSAQSCVVAWNVRMPSAAANSSSTPV